MNQASSSSASRTDTIHAGDVQGDRADFPIRAGSLGEDDGYRGIRICIWTYFWLLMTEGALRKWFLPGLANALLVVKDPVVLVAYFIALRQGRYPKNSFVTWITVLGVVTFAFSTVAFSAGFTNSNFLVTLYGFRTNFLHLPLIFLMADALRHEDLKKIGKWLLIISVPMGLLVLAQFRAPPDALVNVGVGKSEGGQMLAGVGIGDIQKVRAAGAFSFNTGLATYLSLSAAFLAAHFLKGKMYPKALVLIASFAVTGSAALSASRTTTLSIALVGMAGMLCVWVHPRFLRGSFGMMAMVLLVYLVFAQSRTISEGVWVLGERFESADGLKVGILDRTLTGFTEAFETLEKHGFFGKGLGVGTNVAAGLLTGARDFLIAESEWPRVVGEVGPVFGLAYILLRILLVYYLFKKAMLALRRGEPLSMLLFSVCATLLLNGPLGVAATLGFTAFGAGLSLAAAKEEPDMDGALLLMRLEEPDVPKQRGRSRYAEQLHSGKSN